MTGFFTAALEMNNLINHLPKVKSFYNKLNVKIMKFPESKCKSLFLMQNIEINFTFSFDSTMGCI